jgi:hypothetical protein
MPSMPLNRMIAYAVIAAFLPFLFVVVSFLSNNGYLNDLDDKLSQVERLALQQEKRQAQNLTVIRHYRDADHFYIDKRLESIPLLENEVEALQKIVSHKNFMGDEDVKKRLEYLTSTNHLRFSEGVVQTYPQFQETTETLITPVELNVQDIQKILTLAEGVKINELEAPKDRPQLIILDFKLDKKKLQEKNEVFLLNMKLLKREYM